MEKKEHRRKAKRYPVCWKAAVVFDKVAGKPILHTQTQDLSAGGAAIQSEDGDLAGTMVTLLLAQPARDGETPRMVKARARVVSSVRTPPKQGFRHGLSFLRGPGDGLDFLEGLLHAFATAAPTGGEAPAAAPAAPPAGGRLAQLKQLAQAKLSEDRRTDAAEDVNALISESLERAYKYFKELAEQLNVVLPKYPKGYTIVGVPEFSGLAWESGRADMRSRETTPGKRLYEQAMLSFRLSGGKKIRVAREAPASDRLRQVLGDNKIEFKAVDERNERGSLARTVFEFACEVRASVILEGNFQTGRILLKARNVERFGMVEHQLAPRAVTEAALEELAGFILGETPRVGPLLLKDA